MQIEVTLFFGNFHEKCSKQKLKTINKYHVHIIVIEVRNKEAVASV